MNLNLILQNKKIEELTYDSVIVEKPVSNIIDFDYKKILQAPPSNTSKLVEKELWIISKFTKNRTDNDYDLILQIDEDIDPFFINILKKNQLEYPQKDINLFYDIVEPIVANLKSYWNRPRPNQLSKFYNIPINRIVTNTIHTAAYPSGHTFYSKLVANILSDLYPKLSKNFNMVVELTSEARIKQGVHYPSDNYASIILANHLYNKLKRQIL